MKNSLINMFLSLVMMTTCLHLTMALDGNGAGDHFREMSLVEAIGRISQDYNVYFTFDHNLVRDIVVSYETRRELTVEEALSDVLSGTDLQYKMYDKRFVILYKSDAEGLESLKQMVRHFEKIIASGPSDQSLKKNLKTTATLPLHKAWLPQVRPLKSLAIDVEGTVVDENGEPLIGVNVQVKGTAQGTATDIEGRYALEDLNENAVLVFSYVGYITQEITLNGRTTVNLTMVANAELLDEVVVIGYGEMKRSDLSTAQVSIGADAIERSVNTTIEQAIQGRAAGVYITQNTGQPGGGISVNIRGISTLNGSNQPLYVIDGVQIKQNESVSYGDASSSNPLANLNPSDIENIEILQGPSATAIYGSRATNGVVLITTKRGRAGETKINYSYLYSLQDEPQSLPTMNLPQYAQMINQMRALQGQEIRTEFADLSLLGPGTNWQDALFRQAALQKHQLSLSGGSDHTQYYLSGEFYDQEGIALGSGFKRNSIRLNINNSLREWIRLSGNLSYSQTDQQLSTTQRGIINDALRLAPNVPVRNPNGSWGGADEANASSLQFTPLNPVAIANLTQNDLKRKQFLGGVNLDIDLFRGLVFRTSLNSNVENMRQDNFTPTYRIGNRTNDEASLTVRSNNSFYWNWNQMLQYNVNLGNHTLDLMASHESQESTWENLSGSKTGFVTNEIPDLNVGDDQNATTGGGSGSWAMESYFGRVNYNFDNKYYFQGAIRTDGSVRFGRDRKWGTFPSASIAWRVSEEAFLQNVSILDELKIRFETGITGNQGNTSWFGPLNPSATPWGKGFRQGRYSNPELQWEETHTNNLGFNLNILNNRIQIEGDFYIKNTDNLILDAPLPIFLGTNGTGAISPPPINVGALENKGMSFSLQTVNIDRGQFTWTMNANFSMFRTQLTEIYSGADFIPPRVPWYIGDTGSGNNWEQRSAVGKAPWLFRGYLYDGLFQSVEDIQNSPVPADNNGNRLPASEDNVWVGDIKFKDLNGDGIINEQDKTDIGNPWPKGTYGLTNSFSYKGFDLSVLLIGVYGNDVYNLIRFDNTNPNNINLGRNLMEETFKYARLQGEGEGVTLANPETYIPRISPNSTNGNRLRFTDQFVEKGTYLRVKNIQLSYSLPRRILSTQNVLRGARLTVGAQNIYTFTNYSGYDPEVGAYVGNNAASDNAPIGLDYGRYPLTPVYTFSVEVDF